VGDGDVTFAEFLEALAEGGHDAWRLHFGRSHIEAGETLLVTNEGGEAHTFTHVAAFGGGFVPELNEPFGFPGPVPVCGLPGALATFVPAGTSNG
jgi:hypothetical protein